MRDESLAAPQLSIVSMYIGSREIRVWSLKTSAVPSFVLQRFADVLAPWERARADAYVHAADRRDYILAHVLRRALLTDCFDLPARNWVFDNPRLRKPAVVTSVRHGRPECNITHTRGFVAAAVSRDRPVGIDAERHDRPIGPDMAALICSKKEWAALQAIGPDGRMLLRTWVRKEAFAKAVGLGLSLSLPALEFDENGHPSLSGFVSGISRISEWRVWDMKVSSSCVVAVAAHAHGCEEPMHQRIDWRDLEHRLRNR